MVHEARLPVCSLLDPLSHVGAIVNCAAGRSSIYAK
jgi:hypothetical protein